MCVASSGVGIFAGAVILALVCVFLPIITPVCVVCCIKFGICGSNRNRRPKSRVVTTTPSPTEAVVFTTTILRGLTGMSDMKRLQLLSLLLNYACSRTIV